jgi:nitroreductase
VEQDKAQDTERPAGRRSLSPRVVTSLLAAAVAAPSMHNTQPWRFRVRRYAHVIELYADPARALPHSDPHGRAIHIACGAALLNLRLAAAVAGREPVVTLLPDPLQPVLLATVRLAGPYQAQPAESELYAAIPGRHTSRLPFSDRPVPPAELAELVEAAKVEGAILHVLDHNETVRVLRLVRDAERDQLADPAYRAELAQWAGGARDDDGIPDTALGPRAYDPAAPVRDFTAGRAGRRGYAWFEKHPQLAVLSMPADDRASWLRAGQALQRVLLTATARGIAASPLTQPLETADAWLVRDPRSGHEQPQMILRIGYSLPVPSTPRRPVSQVLN